MEKLPEFISNHTILVGAFVVVLFILVFTEVSRKLKKFRELEPKEAVKIINDKEPLIMDLRPESEYKKGHIIGAKSFTIEAIDTRSNELTKFKEKGIIVYAGNPNTAVSALSKLVKQGHTNLYNISGGYQVWVAENMPVEKSKRK